MFVRVSRYRALEAKLAEMRQKAYVTEGQYLRLIKKWNDLVTAINDKGGEAFLHSTGSSDFTHEQIKEMLKLCHPDKHNNSTSSNEITRLLIEKLKQ